MKSRIAFFTAALFVVNAQAQSLSTKIHNPYSSLRALGMGNAFTAVADDYSLILYNPAGFARKKHNEIQITLAGAGVSAKTLTVADDIKKASDTPGTDSEKAQAVSDELEKYYGESLGGKVQALEMFWVNQGWGVALLPADLTVDMSINRQVGPALDLNVKGDSIFALGFGKAVTDTLDAGVTAKYIHRVSVEEILPAFELATDSNVLSTKRFREGTKFDFDVGFMWTPKIGGTTKKVKVKTVAPEAAVEPQPEIPVKAEAEPAPAEAAAPPAEAPAENQTEPAVSAETAPAEPTAPPAEAASTPAAPEGSGAVEQPPAPTEEPGTRTPQQAEVSSEDIPADPVDPAAETPPAETAQTAPETPAEETSPDAPAETPPATTAETPATTEPPPGATPVPVPPPAEVAPLTETEAQQQAAETAPATQEVVEEETEVEVPNESYPLSFGFVVHNVIGGEFSQSTLVNKDATQKPAKLERTYDVGMQYKIVNWEDFTIRYMLDFRNMGYPGATKFNKIVHTGIEFDYSPSTWFKTQLRAGLNQTYFTAGASFLFGVLNIDVVTYGEEVGTVDEKRESRVTAAKVGFNF